MSGTWTKLDRAAPGDAEAQRVFAEEVLVGLSEHPKRLPSRYFYDDEGSRLFAGICGLEAYYPTRIERSILDGSAEAILSPVAHEPLNLVDLGAGDGHKTAPLLRWLEARGVDARYVPIDISEGAMAEAVGSLGARFPGLEVHGIVAEYFEGLSWLARQTERRNLVLFLGSNIGNFDKPRARAFLRRLWNALNPDDRVLIGFDLKKDIERLLLAYNDPEGLTARFNLNLLTRINRELGANFDKSKWRHYGTYNVFTGAMESYLVSLEAQAVDVEALAYTFRFAPWEPIFTEYSYKYLESDIEALAGAAHFDVQARLFDPDRWFCDAVWRVDKR